VDRDQLACWLIDFARTGRGPILRDFVALEALVRWEWISSRRMTGLHRFEMILSQPDQLGAPLVLEDDLPEDLQKAAQVIGTIRRLAADVEGASLDEYLIGLLFHALRIVVSGGTDSPYQYRSRSWRRAHALLSAAMLSQQIEQRARPLRGNVVLECGPFRIEDSGEVWLEGKPGPLDPPLTDKQFKLFSHFCRNANRLCSRDELIQLLWPDNAPDDWSLDQHIHRLRERIEPDPDNPRYIQNIRKRGYRFNV
jgi:hypothetical protein